MPKQIDHDAMRRRLLAAAGAVFAARGYAATGMRDLAAAANVSTGTLYHYFPDKKALFETLVERTIASDLEHLEAALGAVPPNPTARLDAFLTLIREDEEALQMQHAVLVEYARLSRATEGPPLAPLRTTHAQYATALARLLGVAQERADLVLHAVTGLMLQRFIDGGTTPFEPLERQLRISFAGGET